MMYTDMQIEVNSETVELTSETNTYSLCLNREKNMIIPHNHDVSGIFMEFPPELLEVRVLIGKNCVAVFDRNMQDDLRMFPLYLSLSYYMYTELEFVYSKEWLIGQEEYIYVDEYVDEEELGDEVTIWDGYEYHQGKIVYNKEVPTGKTIRKIIKGVTITVPKIVFHVENNNHKCGESLEVPVQQKLNLADYNSNDTEWFMKECNMKAVGEYGFVKNYIKYCGGFAGLKFSYAIPSYDRRLKSSLV